MIVAIVSLAAVLLGAGLLHVHRDRRRTADGLAEWLDLLARLPVDASAELALLERLAAECGATCAALNVRGAGGEETVASFGAPTPNSVMTTCAVGDRGLLALQFPSPPSRRQAAFVRMIAAALVPHVLRKLSDEKIRQLGDQVRSSAKANAQLSLRHDAVLEVLPDGLAMTDDDGQIIRVNAAGREIVGVDDALGPSSRRSLADATNPLVQALREGNTASGLEVAIPGTDSPRVVQVKVSKLTEDPSSRAAVALFRDVTRELLLQHDLRRQGQALERNVKELERATRLKSEFLAGMSHELRTPLNAILGFAEVLLDGTYGSLNDGQAACAKDVLAGGRHLLGLINDILDLSKIEAGRMELNVEDVDATEIASQAITFVRPQAAAKQIHIDLSILPTTFRVRADADRLRQVFVNLLSNAVKFTPKHGRVSVSAEVDDGNVRFTVVDTGIGIAAADLGKLFQEFSQVDGSVTRKFGGTGLGLAISKRLVGLHGGTIGLESEVGVGSRFFFTMPMSTRAARPTFNATAPMRRLGSRRSDRRAMLVPPSVLIVDAEQAAGRLCETLLDEAGIQATTVRTLAEARRAVTSARYEVLVMDPSLPDASIEEANAFATQRFAAATVVISVLPSREAQIGLGVSGFVAKPLDPASFVDQVRAAQQRCLGPRPALVVDANEEDADAVTQLLEREGFAVRVAATLAAARAELARKPALVVLDLDLPDGDGADLLDAVAEISAASIVWTDRTLDAAAMQRVEPRASLLLKKGTLSRSAFARHIAAVCLKEASPRQRILAVDDNEQNLRLISAVLSRRGYEILEARDAASAVRIARAELPTVILMDVMLPDVDGLSATRELKMDILTRGIPVIAVTAQAMFGDEERARAAGCADYVAKPIDPKRLLAAIEAAVAAAA